jgi:CHAD domain-containing protein
MVNAQRTHVDVNVERELKLTAPAGFSLRAFVSNIRDWEFTPMKIRRLHTVYYDTDELSLTRSGISFRYRTGEGWTVKLPISSERSLLSRGEYVYLGSSTSPPSQALDVVAAFTRNRPIRKVAELRTIRQSVFVSRSGIEVAELLHDDVRIVEECRYVGRVAQIEIELRAAATSDVLTSLTADLQDHGAGDLDPVSKSVRALGKRAQEAPEVAVLAQTSRASIAEVVRHTVAASTEAILRSDAHIRLDEGSQWIHGARVATRRLRSNLRSFGPIVDARWSSELREQLRSFGNELGSARDADVLVQHIETLASSLPFDDRPTIDLVLGAVRDVRTSAHRRLLLAMRAESYVVFLDRLVDAARHPKLTAEANRDAHDVLTEVMSQSWRKLSKAVRNIGDDPTDDQLHKIRIKVKRCRYAVEALGSTAGKRSAKLLKRLIRLQDILGALHDAIVERRRLRACVDASDPAFVAGELAGFDLVARANARVSWRKAWRRASRKRLRFWSN